jgi:ketosteroid isomerase-like protein
MKLRTLGVLASMAALVAGCSQSSPQSFKDELIAADKAFNAKSVKDGPKAAFLAFVDKDAKLLSSSRSGADAVENVFMQLPPTATLTWDTSYVDVGSAGDLGYTWGRYTLIVAGGTRSGPPLVQKGTYVTIWKREQFGGWKVVLDGGHPDGEK